MTTRITAPLISIPCFALLISAAVGGEGDVKPVKKIVRAADGLNIVCEVRGKGDTTLVFLHGLCGDREYWKNQVNAFAGEYRVVAIDQAGHGESGKDRKVWTVDSLAKDVEAVVKSLDLKRVILVGHSMSGQVSLMASNRLPGTVVAVIGVDTLPNAEFTMPEEIRKQFLEGFQTDFKESMGEMLPGLLLDKADPELVKWLTTRAEAQDPRMAFGLMRDLTGLDMKPLFKAAKAPVRCINSSGGYAYFTPTAVAINKKYADYDAVLIDGVGHYPMLEKPAEFNQKLRAVLKEFAVKK